MQTNVNIYILTSCLNGERTFDNLLLIKQRLEPQNSISKAPALIIVVFVFGFNSIVSISFFSTLEF